MALFRRSRALDPRPRAALAGLLAAPTFEIVPIRNAGEQTAFLPAGATVSVTASPAKGIEATIEFCERLAARDLRLVPHLAARMIRDRAHLRSLLTRLEAAGIDRAFVVAGDATEAGEFPDGLSLLRAIADAGGRLTEIGIPCYPQGHPHIPDARLLEALAAKAPLASYMTTQLCFDPDAIARWLADRRADGSDLPVHLGVPGVADPHKLLHIGTRIGVADTRRFLAKNTRFVGRLIRSGGFFRPAGLLEDLAPLMADPGAGVRGIHLYTFNAVAATEAWRRAYLTGLTVARSA